MAIPVPVGVAIPSEIEQKIVYENQKYWQNRFLFGNEYFEFVYDVSLNWNTSSLLPKTGLTKNNDFHLLKLPCPKEYEGIPGFVEPLDVKLPMNEAVAAELELRVFKFVAGFYLTI